jgi:predicted dehydrogenase
MLKQNRRSWLRTVGAGAATLSAASYLRAAGANERVRGALIGLGGQGRNQHMAGWKASPNTDLVSICDVDANRLADVAKTDAALKPVADLRQILDDKSIDAVSIATPDHWHTPAALLALAAGKHVYVEKPCAHNLREGRKLVDTARDSKLLVQHGTQSRSNPFITSAIKLLQEGVIGEVLVSKAWNIQARPNIGHEKPSALPPGIDYDTWLGPAPEVPFQGNRFHYNWHWWYDFGTGDMGNDGVHDIDVARWGLGANALPTSIASIGGKYFFDDDQQFPDTQMAVFEYAGDGAVGHRKQLIYEMRLWSTNYPHNTDSGCEFYGTKGQMFLSKRGKLQVLGSDNRPIARELPNPSPLSVPDNFINFVAAIRGEQQLNAPIEEGFRSSALCHLGNLSARLGRSLRLDTEKDQIIGDAEADRLLGREYRSSHWATPKGLA